MFAKYIMFPLALLVAGCIGVDSLPEGDDTDSLSDAVSGIAEGDYVITAAHSGKCVDVAAASTQNGARIQQWDCNGTVAQVFRVTSVGGGYYKIENPNSNKAFDITEVSTQNGAPLQQWGYGGGQNQQFSIEYAGNNRFSIRARHTGKALDVNAWSQNAGAAIIQWPYHGGDNQHFMFHPKGGAPQGPQGWKLVWSDEFNGQNGAPVDGAKWTAETGGHGWGNQELEYYTNSTENARQEDGSLVITATKNGASGYGCWYGTCQYTSARLVTRGKFERTYGRVEARVKIPYGQGIWPAFWMLGANIGNVGWPSCGEIDVMENVGYEPGTLHGSLHGPGYSGGNPLTSWVSLPGGQKLSDAYHVYGVEWEPNVVRFYLDGNLYQTRTPSDLPPGKQWVYDHPFFLLLNVAVGGGWPGSPDGSTVFPQQMRVDWVRVYERN